MGKLFKAILCLLLVSVCVVAPISADSTYEDDLSPYWAGRDAGYDMGYHDASAGLPYSLPELSLDWDVSYKLGIIMGYGFGYTDQLVSRYPFQIESDDECWDGWYAGFDRGYSDGLVGLPYTSPDFLPYQSNSYNIGRTQGYGFGYSCGVYDRMFPQPKVWM